MSVFPDDVGAQTRADPFESTTSSTRLCHGSATREPTRASRGREARSTAEDLKTEAIELKKEEQIEKSSRSQTRCSGRRLRLNFPV